MRKIRRRHKLPKPYFETDLGKLYHANCLDIMPYLDKVDLVLTDPPYGTTKCLWDNIIPFEIMWKQLKQITSNNIPILLFGSEPFSSYLRISNITMFHYDWIWYKNKSGNLFQYKNSPMKRHEIISVFFEGSIAPQHNTNYYPEIKHYNVEQIKTTANKYKYSTEYVHGIQKLKRFNTKKITGYPESIINIPVDKNLFHPTQKPLALMEYFIKTYSNEEDIVLDFTIGSGTTAVACEILNRKWIGIEIKEKYCKIAKERIQREVKIIKTKTNAHIFETKKKIHNRVFEK